MTIVLFILILVVLIVGHEFGHFFAAKLSGMKVPEFGLGFPPKLWGKKIGETEYTVNALPFGGFVKIVGEEISDETEADPAAFSNKPKYLQGATLLAGPLSNLAIAFIFSSAAFVFGVPAATDSGYPPQYIRGGKVTVVEVVPGSPAERAGVKEGDEIRAISSGAGSETISAPEDLAPAVQSSEGPVTLDMVRAGQSLSETLTPVPGIVPDSPDTKALGIATANVGTLVLPPGKAIAAGFTETAQNAWAVLTGIISLIAHAFTLSANLSNVAGPVGIASVAGSAAAFGFGSILSFAALISVNLGVLNLFPFPALDGGRFAFVVAEAVSGKRVPAKTANAINTVGFALLVILMLAVTAHDISRLIA
jgi:regulator of sigma E protease